MMGQSDRYEKKIELLLSNVLQGRSLTQWCSEISKQYLIETKQTVPPFSVLKFLPYRKTNLKHDKNLTVDGKIEVKGEVFIITLNVKKLSTDFDYNFLLAHELAHTFFYDISKSIPANLTILPPGSGYLEYVCNKIARFLLMPSGVIQEELKKLPQITDDSFTLSIINDLVNKFQVSHVNLLARIIGDETLWNCLFLRFEYFNTDKSWRLREKYLPRYLNSQKYFIPPPDKHKKEDSPEKYPSAKNSFLCFISSLESELIKRKGKRTSKRIYISEITGPPLTTFFSNINNGEKVLIHASMGIKNKKINFLLPLP